MQCCCTSAPQLSDPQRRPGLADTAGAGYAFAALGTHRPVIVRGAQSLEQCKVFAATEGCVLDARVADAPDVLLYIVNDARFVARYYYRVLLAYC